MSKLILCYTPSKDIKRDTNNKPEERQRLIVNFFEKNDLCSLFENKFNDKTLDIIKKLDVHDNNYLFFLKDSYDGFKSDNFDEDFTYQEDQLIGLIPNVFISSIDEKIKEKIPLWKHVGLYCTDFTTPIYEHTFNDILASANDVIKGVELLLKGANYVYSVTSNPGHHAGRNFYGGYCFLNNVAIGAKLLLEKFNRIAILDLDYHAGDGTADIISKINLVDKVVLFCSIHMNPSYDYPHYRGFDDNNGKNGIYNFLFQPKDNWTGYKKCLDKATKLISDSKAEVVLVSFGSDTYCKDPEVNEKAGCKLELDDYNKIGKEIKKCLLHNNSKFLMVQEGGYYLDDIGLILQNLINGILC